MLAFYNIHVTVELGLYYAMTDARALHCSLIYLYTFLLMNFIFLFLQCILGRHQENAVCLMSVAISRKHASITKSEEGYYQLHDLKVNNQLSPEMTAVNFLCYQSMTL